MLAPRLKIGEEEYEDLDEIISRRVSACNDLVNDLLATPKVTACMGRRTDGFCEMGLLGGRGGGAGGGAGCSIPASYWTVSPFFFLGVPRLFFYQGEIPDAVISRSTAKIWVFTVSAESLPPIFFLPCTVEKLPGVSRSSREEHAWGAVFVDVFFRAAFQCSAVLSARRTSGRMIECGKVPSVGKILKVE